MRIYVSRDFRRFQKKEKITDKQIKQAVAEIEVGLFDAELGAGLIKKRIARKGEGKSGGYRSLIAIKISEVAFFIGIYAKKELDNINKIELKRLKIVAKTLVRLFFTDKEAFNKLILKEKYIEVK